MISAQELRIGNWVKWEEQFYGDSDYFQIAYVGTTIGLDISKWNGEGTTQRFQNNPIFSQDIKELFPIELTEEWLLNLGWKKREKKNYTYAWYDYVNGCFHIVETIKEKKFMWHEGFHCVEIKHVHQLQNLYFALCGKELELKKEEIK